VTAGGALLLTAAMGAAIFLCRAFPFLFFRGRGGAPGRGSPFLAFVEKTAPPAAMTVLAFNSIAAPARGDPGGLAPALIAAAATALLHAWRRNALLSVFAGTALYMALARAFG